MTQKIPRLIQSSPRSTLTVGPYLVPKTPKRTKTMKITRFCSASSATMVAAVMALMVPLMPIPTATALLISDQPVSVLLAQHAINIAALKEEAKMYKTADMMQPPYNNDVFYLRYCLETPDDQEIQRTKFRHNLAWRHGVGQPICDAATRAIDEATTQGGSKSWDNRPILAAAPSGDVIAQYLTPLNTLTTVSSRNDLIYCIRAGKIDDVSLMQAVTVAQMTAFFLYAKEVNVQVANARSLQTDRLLAILTVNDLAGVALAGGSADFRAALSASSKQANDLFPQTAGPTLLANLPPLLNAIVKIFTPLFPPTVRARLKFAAVPALQVDSLHEVCPGGAARPEFLRQVEALVY